VNEQTLYFDVHMRHIPWQPATTRISGRMLGLSIVLLLLVAAAGLLYLTQASSAAIMHYCLLEQEEEQAVLQERIAFLRCQIASKESILVLENRVQKLGLVDGPLDGPVAVCYVAAPQEPQPPSLPNEDHPQPAGVLEKLLSLASPLAHQP
jgi:hypothetical protein